MKDYLEKYIEYKTKYIQLKNILMGRARFSPETLRRLQLLININRIPQSPEYNILNRDKKNILTGNKQGTAIYITQLTNQINYLYNKWADYKSSPNKNGNISGLSYNPITGQYTNYPVTDVSHNEIVNQGTLSRQGSTLSRQGSTLSRQGSTLSRPTYYAAPVPGRNGSSYSYAQVEPEPEYEKPVLTLATLTRNK